MKIDCPNDGEPFAKVHPESWLGQAVDWLLADECTQMDDHDLPPCTKCARMKRRFLRIMNGQGPDDGEV